MFDFGFSELMTIGTVALVVLGPERLPTVARTAGQWLGKAQRMVADVKRDIEREADLSELKKIQQEAKSAADSLTKSILDQTGSLEKDLRSFENKIKETGASLEKEAMKIAPASPSPDGQNGPEPAAAPATAASGAEPAAVPFDDGAEVGDDAASSWYGDYPQYDLKVAHVFNKRYRSGPSLDELAAQVERLKAELGERGGRSGGNHRRLAARSRVNRARIYR